MSRDHCWLHREYRKQERRLELEELRRVINTRFPDLANRGFRLRLGDRYDAFHRISPPDNYYRFHHRDFIGDDGKRKTLNIMTNPRGTPLWVAPWMVPLREFEPSDLRPPVNAEYALHLILSRDEAEAQIGDLIERYNQKSDRFGPRRADWWFYCEAVRLLWPAIRRTVARVSGLVALAEWIRKYLF
jgi:hypothetical protein